MNDVATLERWVAAMDRVAEACVRLGGERKPTRLELPATFAAVESIEQMIGRRLPVSFRTFVTRQAACLDSSWYLPDEKELPKSLRGIFSGGNEFALSNLESCEKSCLDWIKTCFPDPNDPYDRIWHNALAFCHIANGDHLAFDLTTAADAAVIYLSHEGDDSHGKRMANSFTDLMDRWTPLGCPGSEDWQWLPFCDTSSGLIDPDGPNAHAWLDWLGVHG